MTAPAEWEVIANSPLAETRDEADGRRTHRFDQTEVFSTYLTALVCGPYVMRRLKHGSLDLGLYARRSMEKYLDEQYAEILEITGQGMDFYAQLFDQPYPFSKYDQVFVPEYNSGAMENVGCVTYNEAYLFRDKATDNERLDRAETFLHELAHMWFGNLVTMRWWDDLWLNESFATYISYMAMTEATRFTNAWKVFNSDIKRWAYQQDQLPTTHPISGRAADTEIAFLIFDGITYGKGASVLKQLVKYIGRDAFRDGMRLYFRRHAWCNATLSDFLRCLEESSGMSLTDWAQKWLQTASVNTISARWQAVDGKIESFTLDQTASEQFPTLRPHALEIGFGMEKEGRLHDVGVSSGFDRRAANEHRECRRACPNRILSSPTMAITRTRRSTSTPSQSTTSAAAWSGSTTTCCATCCGRPCGRWCATARIKSTDYLEICRAQLPNEKDLDIVGVVLERVAMTLVRYVPESRRLREVARVVRACAADDHGRLAARCRRSHGLVRRSARRRRPMTSRGSCASSKVRNRWAASSSTRRCAGRSPFALSLMACPRATRCSRSNRSATRPTADEGPCSRRKPRDPRRSRSAGRGTESTARATARSISRAQR